MSLGTEEVMDAKGHEESKGIFIDKMIVFNNAKIEHDLIKTKRSTLISKNSFIKNPSNILASKIVLSPRSIIRSDLCTIKIDSFSIICDHVILKPPMNSHSMFTSITIGKYSIIGPYSIIKANLIGNCVRIGKNCVLEDNVVVEDNCIILDNSILSENTLIPKNTIFGGRPASFISRVPVTT